MVRNFRGGLFLFVVKMYIAAFGETDMFYIT